ncbi:MAG: metalloregulator ArsR/SmtB family transcription factor [Verrucomicrobiaceae bacterium]|nr:metalloregulator ArsR/SmtB family transcription factor [Verrucomicrobiaceae bacterium]
MASVLKSLSLIADPTRVRILLLLKQEELSVAEMQEVLSLPQSNISAQLAKLKAAGLVSDRRSGKNRLYQLDDPNAKDQPTHEHFLALLEAAGMELREVKKDAEALKVVLKKRAQTAQAYFDALAGKFGRHYIPGRSWKGLGETLLKLMPPLVIADLGAGEGTLSQLLAQRAKKVIAVDNSEKMVTYGSDLAKQHGFTNLEYRLGDIEEPPITPLSVDLVFLSQALHHFEPARDLYADVWLGFSESDLHEMLGKAGFKDIETSIVHRESNSPHFQTLLALAEKENRFTSTGHWSGA